MVFRAVLCILLSLVDGLQFSGARPAASRSTSRSVNPSLFFDFKKMIDPENAMERGVLVDELTGGDGSPESLAKTKSKKKQKAQKGGGFEVPKFEMPKSPFGDMPNPFAPKK